MVRSLREGEGLALWRVAEGHSKVRPMPIPAGADWKVDTYLPLYGRTANFLLKRISIRKTVLAPLSMM